MILERSSASRIIKHHQNRAPVKVVSLASDLGLQVYSSHSLSKGVSGLIRRDKTRGGSSGFVIVVNKDHARVRRRFTVAHEIAHYILHEPMIGDGIIEDELLRADGFTNTVERQANKLAADILMPWHLLDQAQDEGSDSIEELASMFEVSRDAMSYRLLGLSYIDALASGRA